MKKKWLIGALTVACACACAFGLAACGDEAEGDGHHYAEAWSSNPTYHWHVCEDADCTEETERVAHTYNEGTVTQSATCTAKGSETFTCTVCGYQDVRETAALTHNLDYTKDNYTHRQICTREDWQDDLEEPHSFGEAQLSNGKLTATCETCGFVATGNVAGTSANPIELSEDTASYTAYLRLDETFDYMTENSYYTLTPSAGMTATFSFGEKANAHITYGIVGAFNSIKTASAAEFTAELQAGETYYFTIRSTENYPQLLSFDLGIHKHTYEANYTTNGAYHWYEPSCHESAAKIVKTPHTFSGGECTVCHMPAPAGNSNLTYTYDTANKTASVKWNPQTSDDADELTNIIIPSTVEYEQETYTVTAIDANAFNNGNAQFKQIESITIPATIRTIGSGAFTNQENLTKLYLYDLEAWSKVTFEGTYSSSQGFRSHPFGVSRGGDIYLNGVKQENLVLEADGDIAKYAFYFSNIQTVTVNVADNYQGEGIAIGERAFCACQSLTEVTLGEGVTSIVTNAFEGVGNIANQSLLRKVTLPQSLNSISSNAFAGCESMKELYLSDLDAWLNLTLPAASAHPLYKADGVGDIYVNGVKLENLTLNLDKDLSASAFYRSSIKSLTINASAALSIGNNAFQYCASLTSVTVNVDPSVEGAVAIGTNAFANCTSLKKLIFRANSDQLSFDYNAFKSCSTLSELDVPDMTTYFALNWEDSGHPFQVNAPGKTTQNRLYFNGVEVTGTVDLTDVATIPDYAFAGCKNITGATFTGVNTIGKYAFAGSGITALDLAGVSTVGNYAFAYTGLTGVNVTAATVNNYAFAYNENLVSVTIANTVDTLKTNTFGSDSAIRTVIVKKTTDFTTAHNAIFNGCMNDRDLHIYFEGTQAEYEAMTNFKAAVTNKISEATVYYYSATAPEDDGNFWYYDGASPVIWEAQA